MTSRRTVPKTMLLFSRYNTLMEKNSVKWPVDLNAQNIAYHTTLGTPDFDTTLPPAFSIRDNSGWASGL